MNYEFKASMQEYSAFTISNIHFTYNVIFKVNLRIDYIKLSCIILALYSSILYSAKFCDKFKNL